MATIINLSTPKGKAKFNEMGDHGQLDDLREKCSFQAYLKSGKRSPLRSSDHVVYNIDEGDDAVGVKNKTVYFADSFSGVSNGNFDSGEEAVIVDCPVRRGKAKGLFTILLLNADGGGYTQNLVDTFGAEGHPAVSFECLGQMFKSREQAIEFLVSGRLKLLDYTEEHRKPLTAAEKKQANNKVGRLKLVPPVGYSLVGDEWHRSGSCLFLDKKTKRTLLFGQDEGSYFGCEIPGQPTTIEKAYTALMPKEVQGKAFQRQGEWFVVPVVEKAVPATKDCTMQFEPEHNEAVYLSLETPDSNKHSIQGSDVEGRVGKNGQIYVKNGRLEHDQHATIYLESSQWYTFYKNTAIRSVSQEGVD